ESLNRIAHFGDPFGKTDPRFFHAFVDIATEVQMARLAGALRVGLEDPQRLGVFTVLSGGLSVVAGLVHTPPRGERGLMLALLAGFCVLWIAFAGATGMIEEVQAGAHWVRFIRFAPLVFALLLLVALSLGPALSARGEARGTPPAKMARIGATLMVSLGAVHAAQIIDGGSLGRARENLGVLKSVAGYELRGAFVKIVPRLTRENDGPSGYAGAASPLAALEVPTPGFLTAEVASAIAHGAPGLRAPELAAALADFGFEGEQDARVGSGAIVLQSVGGDVHGALSGAAADPVSAEALGRYGHGYLSLEAYVGNEVAAARDTAGRAAFLRGAGRRIFRCSVMQLYWGPETRLNPGALAARIRAAAPGWGAGPDDLEALLLGAADAARDFGFGAIADKLSP
ncbi:MAG: hypothetical protein AAGG01_13430, partial [Planctomycetota bacterium]